MSIIRRGFGYAKMGCLYLLGHRVNAIDYGTDYDNVSTSYTIWLDRMSRHTDHLLDMDLLPSIDEPLRIIDLACGTGYITRSILNRLAGKRNVIITCVDMSHQMLAECRNMIDDPRVEFIESDGLDYMKSLTPGSIHAIYCGWGMVYFPQHRLLSACHSALKSGGIMGSIMNCYGTLTGIERMFIDVMSEYPEEVHKVMDIRLKLAPGEDGFASWFTRQGFKTIFTGSGEELVDCPTPNDCYSWLHNTGVIAGTDKLFRNLEKMRPVIIDNIASRLRVGDTYRVNHKFVYGLFRRI